MSVRQYSEAEVAAILAKAAEGSNRTPGLDYNDLRDVARGAGIDEASLAAAIVSFERDTATAAAETNARAVLRSRFTNHAIVYAIVIAGLALLNLATEPHVLWFLGPALGWGLGLVLHGRAALFPNDESLAREQERVRRRQEKRERRAKVRRAVGAVSDTVLDAVLDATEPSARRSRVSVAEPGQDDSAARRPAAEDDETVNEGRRGRRSDKDR
jgi:hypothetical protein